MEKREVFYLTILRYAIITFFVVLGAKCIIPVSGQVLKIQIEHVADYHHPINISMKP